MTVYYYLKKDGVTLDHIRQDTERVPFSSFDLHYLVDNLLTFPDESIPSFFTRVCTYSSCGASAMIDGCYYSVEYEVD
ncbi:MAG: hypothetical protein WC365_01295 [Candidatus Babeliales bacterium]|jgi:hypothetical protein